MSEQNSLGLLAARKAGHVAIIIVVCVLIWAFSSHGDGYFWPIWVIFFGSLDVVIHVGKAAIGDKKARERLQKRYGDSQ